MVIDSQERHQVARASLHVLVEVFVQDHRNIAASVRAEEVDQTVRCSNARWGIAGTHSQPETTRLTVWQNAPTWVIVIDQVDNVSVQKVSSDQHVST